MYADSLGLFVGDGAMPAQFFATKKKTAIFSCFSIKGTVTRCKKTQLERRIIKRPRKL